MVTSRKRCKCSNHEATPSPKKKRRSTSFARLSMAYGKLHMWNTKLDAMLKKMGFQQSSHEAIMYQ
jgi:hypothetical protein